MYVSGIILMIIAMKYGNNVHQLKVGGLSFQPAQFSIVAGFIMMAWVLQDLAKWHPLLSLPGAKVAAIAILALIPFGLVAVMGDLGSAIVWLPVTAIVMLVGGVPFRYLAVISLLGAAIMPILFHVILPSIFEEC
jgi:rod shape determining protein RodA